jgi:SAM-dependent methyltransferase
MNWYEDKDFWIDLCPFLFQEHRFEDAPNEVDFILSQVAKPVRSALDLCCGPGRHAIALAKRGIDVTAVDLTAHYLEMAREAAKADGIKIEFVQEDMRNFVRPKAYDLALIMYSSLGFFEDEREDQQVLRHMYESLTDGGTLLLEMAGKEWVAEHYEDTSCDDLPDGSVLVQRHKIIDDWRRVHNEWILIKGDRAKTYTFDHRLYSGTELSDRLLDAGFRSVCLKGSLEGDEYTFGAKRLVAAAVK